MATDPYVPNPVPTGGDVTAIERYLDAETSRIALAIRTTTVQAAFAGLTITVPLATGFANIIAQQLVGWDSLIPARPDRVVEEGDALVVLEGGTYSVTCQVNVIVNSGRTYNLRLRKNDLIAPIYGTWETSQQTASMWMTFQGIVEARPGDAFSVWYESTLDASQWDVQNASFQCFRISELMDIPA